MHICILEKLEVYCYVMEKGLYYYLHSNQNNIYIVLYLRSDSSVWLIQGARCSWTRLQLFYCRVLVSKLMWYFAWEFFASSELLNIVKYKYTNRHDYVFEKEYSESVWILFSSIQHSWWILYKIVNKSSLILFLIINTFLNIL